MKYPLFTVSQKSATDCTSTSKGWMAHLKMRANGAQNKTYHPDHGCQRPLTGRKSRPRFWAFIPARKRR